MSKKSAAPSVKAIRSSQKATAKALIKACDEEARALNAQLVELARHADGQPVKGSRSVT